MRDYNLMEYKRQQNNERRRAKDEREMIARLRVFARFHSADEHEQFIKGLIEAKQLRKRIEQLQNYRRCGIKTHAEALQYDIDKRKRETDQKMSKQKESSAYAFPPRAVTTTLDRTTRYHKRNRESMENGDGSLFEGLGADASIRQTRNGGGMPLNIGDAPGVELLSQREKELCTVLRLLPKHYLVIKDALLRESFRQGYLKKSMAKQLVTVDVHKTKKIYEFFVSCGWVSPTLKTEGEINVKVVKGGAEEVEEKGQPKDDKELNGKEATGTMDVEVEEEKPKAAATSIEAS